VLTARQTAHGIKHTEKLLAMVDSGCTAPAPSEQG